MSNPLKILTQLTASKSAVFEEGLSVNGQKVTNLADGTVSSDAINLGQLTSLSSSVKSYVDAANSAQDSATSGLSSSLKSYVDAANSAQDSATSALSSSIKSYVDAANNAQDSATSAMSSSIKSYVDAANNAQDSATSALSSSMKSYVDAADTALSSSLKTYIDAQDAAQDSATSALSSSIKSYVDAANSAQDSATSALSSSMKSYVDAANSAQDSATSALSSSVAAAIGAEASARAAEDLLFLKLDGSRSMSGALNMGGQDIVSAKSGSFSGDVTVGGNLQVNGALTYINSTNLEVTDKQITIAKGAANAAAADGAGVLVDGANATLTYNNTEGKWVSNIGMKVSGDTELDGLVDAVKVTGDVTRTLSLGVDSINLLVENTSGLYQGFQLQESVGWRETNIYAAAPAGVTSSIWLGAYSADQSWEDGAYLYMYNDGNIEFGSQKAGTKIQLLSKLEAPVLETSGSAFLHIDTVRNVSTGLYNVDEAIHDLDAAISGAVSDNSALSSSMKSYVDAQNSAQDSATSALSSSMKSYVDAANNAQDSATAAISSSIKSYVDAANNAQDSATSALSSSIKTYVDAADTALQSNLNSVSSSMKSYVDAQNSAQDSATSALSSSIKSYVDAANSAQDSATTALSSSIKSYVDAANSAQDSATSALSSSVSSSLAAETSARVAEDLTFLKLDGSRSMTGALNMGGQDIVSAKSGSFSGDVTVAGNLQVNGSLTYINSTNLEVTDKLITVAKGAANGAAADGAGIEVDGAGVSFVYDNAAGKWVSDIGLSVAGEAVFEGAMKLSGSAFVNITTPVVSGTFDVSDAIHALDTKVGDNATAISNKYDALRLVVTGTLSSGTVTLNLSTLGGAQFVTAEMANIALDVMTDADNTGYTNDLVAIKLFTDAGALKVTIDAPAAPSAKYRLIAVNEKDGGLA